MLTISCLVRSERLAAPAHVGTDVGGVGERERPLDHDVVLRSGMGALRRYPENGRSMDEHELRQVNRRESA